MAIGPDRRALLTGLVLGLLVGVAVGGAFGSGSLPIASEADRTDQEPGLSYGRAGPSCFDGPGANDGWMHVVANGRTWLVTVNATIVHPPGTAVEVDLSQQPTGSYEIAFRTVASTPEKPPEEQDCELATSYEVATGLPEPTVVITMNGRPVRAVDQDETVANLYPLPNPVVAEE